MYITVKRTDPDNPQSTISTTIKRNDFPQKVEKYTIQTWAIYLLIAVAILTGVSVTMNRLEDRRTKAIIP